MNRKSALLSRLTLYSLAAFLFSAVPTSIVELGSICIIYHLTGYQCLMCGMTRAFSNAMHFAFSRAVSFNPLIVIIFPLFWFLFVDDIVAFISVIRGGHYYSILERIWFRMDSISPEKPQIPYRQIICDVSAAIFPVRIPANPSCFHSVRMITGAIYPLFCVPCNLLQFWEADGLNQTGSLDPVVRAR